MKTMTILCLVSLLLSQGCSTMHYVPRDPWAREFVLANGDIEGLDIKTVGGSRLKLDRPTLRADTLSGYDHDTHAVVAFPLSDVDQIALTSVARGVVRGADIGFPSGEYMAFGAMVGAITLSTETYKFVEEVDPRLGNETHYAPDEDPRLRGLLPSEVITLESWPLQDETPEAVSILWDRKPLWLSKSRIKFERLSGGLGNLTVPRSLLEPPRDK